MDISGLPAHVGAWLEQATANDPALAINEASMATPIEEYFSAFECLLVPELDYRAANPRRHARDWFADFMLFRDGRYDCVIETKFLRPKETVAKFSYGFSADLIRLAATASETISAYFLLVTKGLRPEGARGKRFGWTRYFSEVLADNPTTFRISEMGAGFIDVFGHVSKNQRMPSIPNSLAIAPIGTPHFGKFTVGMWQIARLDATEVSFKRGLDGKTFIVDQMMEGAQKTPAIVDA